MPRPLVLTAHSEVYVGTHSLREAIAVKEAKQLHLQPVRCSALGPLMSAPAEVSPRSANSLPNDGGIASKIPVHTRNLEERQRGLSSSGPRQRSNDEVCITGAVSVPLLRGTDEAPPPGREKSRATFPGPSLGPSVLQANGANLNGTVQSESSTPANRNTDAGFQGDGWCGPRPPVPFFQTDPMVIDRRRTRSMSPAAVASSSMSDLKAQWQSLLKTCDLTPQARAAAAPPPRTRQIISPRSAIGGHIFTTSPAPWNPQHPPQVCQGSYSARNVGPTRIPAKPSSTPQMQQLSACTAIQTRPAQSMQSTSSTTLAVPPPRSALSPLRRANSQKELQRIQSWAGAATGTPLISLIPQWRQPPTSSVAELQRNQTAGVAASPSSEADVGRRFSPQRSGNPSLKADAFSSPPSLSYTFAGPCAIQAIGRFAQDVSGLSGLAALDPQPSWAPARPSSAQSEDKPSSMQVLPPQPPVVKDSSVQTEDCIGDLKVSHDNLDGSFRDGCIGMVLTDCGLGDVSLRATRSLRWRREAAEAVFGARAANCPSPRDGLESIQTGASTVEEIMRTPPASPTPLSPSRARAVEFRRPKVISSLRTVPLEMAGIHKKLEAFIGRGRHTCSVARLLVSLIGSRTEAARGQIGERLKAWVPQAPRPEGTTTPCPPRRRPGSVPAAPGVASARRKSANQRLSISTQSPPLHGIVLNESSALPCERDIPHPEPSAALECERLLVEFENRLVSGQPEANPVKCFIYATVAESAVAAATTDEKVLTFGSDRISPRDGSPPADRISPRDGMCREPEPYLPQTETAAPPAAMAPGRGVQSMPPQRPVSPGKTISEADAVRSATFNAAKVSGRFCAWMHAAGTPDVSRKRLGTELQDSSADRAVAEKNDASRELNFGKASFQTEPKGTPVSDASFLRKFRRPPSPPIRLERNRWTTSDQPSASPQKEAALESQTPQHAQVRQ